MELLRALYRRLVPKLLRDTVRSWRILSGRFGHWRSLRERACVGADGRPLPWYTYPAIEYLEQLDLSERSVFEFGSGNSTRYWAGRCARVVSVEDNPAWHERVRADLPGHVECLLCQGAEAYAGAIRRYPAFDLIVIDGNYRLECARAALDCLKPGGVIILDNSDWHERTATVLHGSGLLHVSMSGFGPMLPYTWATSFFFSREARFAPRHARHPMYAIGSIPRTEADQRGEKPRP